MVKSKNPYYRQPILIAVFSLRMQDSHCAWEYGNDSVNYTRQTWVVVFCNVYGIILIKLALFPQVVDGYVHLIYLYATNNDEMKLTFSK